MKSVEILLSKFGEVFSSRMEGREAALSTIAYHLSQQKPEVVVINFDQVLIMTPSWLSEFVQTLKNHGISHIQYKNSANKSVSSSIEMVEIEAKSYTGRSSGS
jgi:hypothetical protein